MGVEHYIYSKIAALPISMYCNLSIRWGLCILQIRKGIYNFRFAKWFNAVGFHAVDGHTSSTCRCISVVYSPQALAVANIFKRMDVKPKVAVQSHVTFYTSRWPRLPSEKSSSNPSFPMEASAQNLSNPITDSCNHARHNMLAFWEVGPVVGM